MPASCVSYVICTNMRALNFAYLDVECGMRKVGYLILESQAFIRIITRNLMMWSVWRLPWTRITSRNVV